MQPCIRTISTIPSKDAQPHLEPSRRISNAPETTNGNSNAISQAPNDGQDKPDSLLPDDTKALLEGQRKDIDRIMTNVDNLLQDMKTVKATMEYLKFQQKTFASFNEHDPTGSPSDATEDLQALTKRFSDVLAKADKVDALTNRVQSLSGVVSQFETKTKETDSLTRELRDLSKVCVRLDTKVNEVDRLKLEVRLMRRRIKQLEDVNGYPPASNLATRLEVSSQPNTQRRSEPICNDTGTSQEIHSSTIERSQSEHVPTRPRSNDTTISLQGDGYDYMLDVDHEQPQDVSHYLNERDTTPEANLVDLLRPQITSADKVAAQKRRRAQSSSSSSFSPITPHRRQVGGPRIHGKPDWNTKPRPNGSAKKKVTSLNDPEHVLTSDPEDSDFDPFSLPNDYLGPHTKDGNRALSKAPLRLPTPDWEKPDWEGPTTIFNSTRGRSTARRGVSGRDLFSKRDAVRRRNSGYGAGDYVSAQSPEYWEEQDPTQRSSATPDLSSKPRDAQGRLIRQNGKVDGRSLRHQREREARAKLAAQLQRSNKGQARTVAGMRASGSSTPASGLQYIDAAALEAAGYKGLTANRDPKDPGASTLVLTTVEPSTGDSAKRGLEISARSASTATATAAPQHVGGDKHAKLMNQVFPWR